MSRKYISMGRKIAAGLIPLVMVTGGLYADAQPQNAEYSRESSPCAKEERSMEPQRNECTNSLDGIVWAGVMGIGITTAILCYLIAKQQGYDDKFGPPMGDMYSKRIK